MISQDIVQHLMCRGKAAWVLTKRASLKILSHGTGRMRSQSSDAFRNLIDANRENAVLFLEKCVKLSEVRSGNVPVIISQLEQEYVLIGKRLSQSVDCPVRKAISRFYFCCRA